MLEIPAVPQPIPPEYVMLPDVRLVCDAVMLHARLDYIVKPVCIDERIMTGYFQFCLDIIYAEV